MINLLLLQKTLSEKEIKDYGVTEIFIHADELYCTSKYDIPFEILEKLESELLN